MKNLGALGPATLAFHFLLPQKFGHFRSPPVWYLPHHLPYILPSYVGYFAYPPLHPPKPLTRRYYKWVLEIQSFTTLFKSPYFFWSRFDFLVPRSSAEPHLYGHPDFLLSHLYQKILRFKCFNSTKHTNESPMETKPSRRGETTWAGIKHRTWETETRYHTAIHALWQIGWFTEKVAKMTIVNEIQVWLDKGRRQRKYI